MRRVKSKVRAAWAMLLGVGGIGTGCAHEAREVDALPRVKPHAAGVFDVKLTAGAPGGFVFTVTNTSDVEAVFCTYHTPFEGIGNDIFTVTGPEGTLAYQGIMASRAPPRPTDFRTVAAGAAVSVAFELGHNYVVGAGPHTLQYKATDISGLPASNILSFTIEPGAPVAATRSSE